MPNLITIPEKSSGDAVSAAEFNQVLAVARAIANPVPQALRDQVRHAVFGGAATYTGNRMNEDAPQGSTPGASFCTDTSNCYSCLPELDGTLRWYITYYGF